MAKLTEAKKNVRGKDLRVAARLKRPVPSHSEHVRARGRYENISLLLRTPKTMKYIAMKNVSEELNKTSFLC